VIVPIAGETCVRPIAGTVDPRTAGSLMAANVAAMGVADWAALLFATGIAALAVVGELKVRHYSVCSRAALSMISRTICAAHP
jgi:hypothetical protein